MQSEAQPSTSCTFSPCRIFFFVMGYILKETGLALLQYPKASKLLLSLTEKLIFEMCFV